MSNKKKKKRKNETLHELADLRWGLILFLWICWWPLGVGLTIGKLYARKKLEEEEFRQDWAERSTRPTDRAPGPGEYGYRPGTAQPQQTVNSQQPRTGAQDKTARQRGWLTPLLLILGALLAVGGAGLLIEGIDFLVYLGQLWDSWTFTEYLLPGALSLAGGVGMIVTGLRNRKTAKQERLLCTIVGPRDHVSLKELSAASGLSDKKTRKLVQSAIGHGLFGSSAYLDMRSETLVVRGSAPAPKPEPPAAPKPAPKEDRYQALLRQLREANDAIPGEEMSDKISRMELVSARIFELVKKDPGKEPQLQRFMDYYLPTSLKLLNTYATLGQQGMNGENINETKANIENAMDLLVTAFENQLDKLYESDALDVSSDIAALQGMLNLDGLTPPRDFTAPAPPPPKDTGR